MGLTASKRLALIDRLEEAGKAPEDRSQIVHTFMDGWTIRKITCMGDAHREGILMSHCWNLEKEDPSFDSSHLWENPWIQPEELAKGGYPHEAYSLRDENNLPHVSFFAGPRLWTIDCLGQHNSYPKDKYLNRIKKWCPLISCEFEYPIWWDYDEMAG